MSIIALACAIGTSAHHPLSAFIAALFAPHLLFPFALDPLSYSFYTPLFCYISTNFFLPHGYLQLDLNIFISHVHSPFFCIRGDNDQPESCPHFADRLRDSKHQHVMYNPFVEAAEAGDLPVKLMLAESTARITEVYEHENGGNCLLC
jgi:hypothetical protein